MTIVSVHAGARSTPAALDASERNDSIQWWIKLGGFMPFSERDRHPNLLV